MTQKLLDTNVIIDSLQEKQYQEGKISIITLIEVLRGINKEKRQKIKQLLEKTYKVIEIDNKTILTYSNLYNETKNKGKTLPDADLLIASTAISHNLTLITNDQHFQKIKNKDLETKNK